MNRKWRRIYYFIFILIFLVSVPILVFYASGYRYDFQQKKLFKTGSLVIESEPKGAEIYIKGELKKDKTPIIVNYLLPGDYEVRVEKEGYYNWEKILTIKPKITTEARDIVLIKKSEAKNLVKENIEIITLSPNKQKMVYSSSKNGIEEIWILDLLNQESVLLYKNQLGRIKEILWSPQTKKILILAENDNLILNIENPQETISFNQTFNLKFTNLEWDDQGDNILFGIHNKNLYKIEIGSKKLSLIIPAKIISYSINQNQIFLVEEESDDFKLKTLNKNNISEIQTIFSLPPSDNYQFIKSQNGIITLLDPIHQQLFLIERLANFSVNSEIISSVKNASWSKNNKLLYYNDFEIWVYALEKNQKELINRYSQEVKEVIWLNESEYLVFIEGENIKITELNSRNRRNTIDLIKIPSRLLTLDKKSENLYFLGKIDNQNQLFKINIR